MVKSDKKLGKLERELLIKVSLPPLDKYSIFQVAKRHSIFLIIPSQIDFALNEAPNGRPMYLHGQKGHPTTQDTSNPTNIHDTSGN